MFKDRYNYKLNGVEHEIILNNNIKIDMTPINEKILISNKFMLKYINDLFDFYNIEYFCINNVLLGQYVFKGINIFQKNIEVATLSINLHKIKKIENELMNDDFQISYYENYIKITTTFLKKYKTSIYIYLVNHNNEEDTIEYTLYNKTKIFHKFYDIYPVNKDKFEEFNISIPNKIENVLISYSINLNYIVFSNNKELELQKIIDENQDISYYEKFISIIKPLLWQ
jgi:hypothetical protein